MYHCTRSDCGWRSIAPSEEAAFDQYVDHLMGEHASYVEADIPEGMVQVRFGEDDAWVTVTPEEAHRLHREHHGGD